MGKFQPFGTLRARFGNLRVITLKTLAIAAIIAGSAWWTSNKTASAMALVDFTPNCFNTATCATSNTTGTLGWQFVVDNPITINALGIFDIFGDGLFESHRVGIWALNNTTALATTTVQAGTASTLIDGFRYENITPLLLAPGIYRLGAEYILDFMTGSADGYVRNLTGGAVFTTHPDITFSGGVRGGGFSYPNLFDNGLGVGGFGPNAQVVPIPAALPLFLSALAVFGFVARKRRSAAAA